MGEQNWKAFASFSLLELYMLLPFSTSTSSTLGVGPRREADDDEEPADDSDDLDRLDDDQDREDSERAPPGASLHTASSAQETMRNEYVHNNNATRATRITT